MRRIFSSVKLKAGQFAGLLVLILLSAVGQMLSAVGQMLLPAFLSNMIGEGVATGQTDAIWFYGAIMAGVTVFSCVISFSNMIGEGVATGQTDAIWFYGAIMAGVTVFSCVISFLSVKIASHISTDFAFQLREKVFAKVQSFSTAEME